MITANAAKLAEKEYRRRCPRRGYPWWALLFLMPFWLLVAAAAAMASWKASRELWHGDTAVPFLVALGIGIPLFFALPMRPLYIFGHELTHWLAAKLTFHKTGAFQMKENRGFVEIPEPTGFIALAPYFVPFYFLLSGCILAFTAFAWTAAPEILWTTTAAWMGLCYAYHLSLTARALARGQKDLEFCGKYLSYAIILAGNLLVLAGSLGIRLVIARIK